MVKLHVPSYLHNNFFYCLGYYGIINISIFSKNVIKQATYEEYFEIYIDPIKEKKFLMKIFNNNTLDEYFFDELSIERFENLLAKTRHNCVGCGYCCIKSACEISQYVYNISPSNLCPALIWDKNYYRYYCKLVLENKYDARENLYIGAGCCSNLNSWRNNIKERN